LERQADVPEDTAIYHRLHKQGGPFPEEGMVEREGLRL
jgi:hypothetical protein